MNLGLSDRIILVSGGGSGIGQAISRLCLEEGASVVIAGRRSHEVTTFEEEVRVSHSKRLHFFEAELADASRCEAAIAFVQTTHGRLDALVNNAGANDSIGLETGDPLRFQESLRQNLLHYYSLAHFSLPLLRQTQGSIVNISSKVAFTGQGGTSAYAAAKGAQLALTREWAAELLPFRIRVNAVIPAEVRTPLYEQWLGDYGAGIGFRAVEQRIPLERRMTRPSEIAAAVCFLLSPTHSAHTTGQHVFVDGGYTHLDRAITTSQ